jgi:hypothetical protein
MRQCHHELLNAGARQPQCGWSSERVLEIEANVISLGRNLARCQRGNVYLSRYGIFVLCHFECPDTDRRGTEQRRVLLWARTSLSPSQAGPAACVTIVVLPPCIEIATRSPRMVNMKFEVKVMVASGWQRWVVSCRVAAVSTKQNFAAIRPASGYPECAVGRSRKRFGDESRPYSGSR